MENPRFVAGELGTHFIEIETNLMDEMKQIMERERTLNEKASGMVTEKRKIAAIAAVSAFARKMA
jgi:pyruvate carboxylase subunit A